jgi:nickel-type superoxide dismutase maturation protease
VDLLLWRIGRRERFVVRGGSMEPTLGDGDEVLVDPRAYRRRPPRVGDVVLIQHPLRGDVRAIKRVAELREGGVWVLGDNPRASTDSRIFGPVPLSHLLGRVARRLPEA